MKLIVASILVFLAAPAAAQLSGLYEFDAGGDGGSWDDATNWEQVLAADGTPISGNPASSPDTETSADIPLPGVVIDATMPGQTALDVRVGTPVGAGLLTISGGDLTLRDLYVGSDPGGVNAGTLSLSGGTLIAGDDITIGDDSPGTMTMTGGSVSTGDDFFINESNSFSMAGGDLFVGDRLVLDDNAVLSLNGGDITVDDDFFAFGSSQITVDGGSIVVHDKLQFDDDPLENGRLTINAGVVRSNEFGVDDGSADVFRGVVEINGSGVYQVEAPDGPASPPTQLSVADALALIAGGIHFVTTDPGMVELVASSVIVPEFDGRQDVLFTQISLQGHTVGEPAVAALLTLALVGTGFARRRRGPLTCSEVP